MNVNIAATFHCSSLIHIRLTTIYMVFSHKFTCTSSYNFFTYSPFLCISSISFFSIPHRSFNKNISVWETLSACFFSHRRKNKTMTTESREIVTLVYIGGFLVPENRLPFSADIVPSHVRVIALFPSGVSSLHDRVCQCFYELVGGTVHYGKEHSMFHGHSEEGHNFAVGKYPLWGPENPIHIVGHSFGGITARVLLAYLKRGNMFPGYKTTSDWVTSVVSMNGPLNGCLHVYGLGANLTLPPCVRWASLGCIIGWLAHIFEYVGTNQMRSIYDFKLAYWPLRRSLRTLGLAMLGICVHTTTDNSAYDMTVQSQMAWADHLPTLSQTYFMSVVGTSYRSAPAFVSLAYSFLWWTLRSVPKSVAEIDTSQWLCRGYDGLLSTSTQEYPKLGLLNHKFKIIDEPLGDENTVSSGVWYVLYLKLDHLGADAQATNEAWASVWTTCETFQKARSMASPIESDNDNKPLQPPLAPDEIIIDDKMSLPSPDMQRVSWSIEQRPMTTITNFQTFAVIALTSVVAYMISNCTRCNVPDVHASIASAAGPIVLLRFCYGRISSDFVEGWVTALRLAILIFGIQVSSVSYEAIALLFVMEATVLVSIASCFDYTTPVTKAVIGLIIIGAADSMTISSSSPSATYGAILLVGIDAPTLIARMAWLVTNNLYLCESVWSIHPAELWTWSVIWGLYIGSSVLCICIAFFAMCLLSSIKIPQLGIFILWVLFNKLRDISDAFQVFFILTKDKTR